MKEIDDGDLISLLPFGTEERDGRLVCLLCETEQHCETVHQKRLAALVEHPMLLMMTMTSSNRSPRMSYCLSTTQPSRVLTIETKRQRNHPWIDLAIRRGVATATRVPLAESNEFMITPSHQNNDSTQSCQGRRADSWIALKTTSSRPLALLSPEDANYEWQCDTCGVSNMRSKEYWEHCLTEEHLERRQAAAALGTDTGTMKDQKGRGLGILDCQPCAIMDELSSPYIEEKENHLTLEKQDDDEPLKDPCRERPFNIVTPTGDKELESASAASMNTVQEEEKNDDSDVSSLKQLGEEQADGGFDEEEDIFDGMSVLQTPSPVKPTRSDEATIPASILCQKSADALLWNDSLRKVIENDAVRQRTCSEDLTPMKSCESAHRRTCSLGDARHVGVTCPKNLLAALDHNDEEDGEDDAMLLFAATPNVATRTDNRLEALLNELALR